MYTPSFRTRTLPRTLATGAALALLLLAAGVVFASRPVQAASSITVDTLADGDLDNGAATCVSTAGGGRCTLRAALQLNDRNGGGSTITLGVPGQIELSHGELVIAHSVTITGGGHAVNTVNGAGQSRVFFVESFTAQVAMTGFTVTGANGSSGAGGAILNLGNLTLTDVVIKGGIAGFGGGIADFGTLTLASGDALLTNTAEEFGSPQGSTGGDGGGIAEFGQLNVKGALFSGNTAQGSALSGGGNLFVSSATVTPSVGPPFLTTGRATVAQSTFAQGTAGSGGGLFVDSGESAAVMTSTFVANSSSNTPPSEFFGGGAINNFCGALRLTNDTFDANHTFGPGGAIDQECELGLTFPPPSPGQPARRSVSLTISVSGSGDARVTVATTPTPTQTPLAATGVLDFVTMADNIAPPFLPGGQSRGSAIALIGDLNTMTVHDTIIAKSLNDPTGDCAFFERGGAGDLTSLGYNLETANDCGFDATGDQTNVNRSFAVSPFGALANNGGPTQTMALAAGSPAVDTADPKCDVTTDQRGVSRPQGPRCDIGAFELEQATPVTPLPSPPVTGQGPARSDPSLIALILSVLALLLMGIGLLIARRRTA